MNETEKIKEVVMEKYSLIAKGETGSCCGGRIAVSDVVLSGELPDSIASASEMYAGCVSGAMQKSDYLMVIESEGLKNVRIRKEKDINVPDDLLMQYATRKEIDDYRALGSAIKSITVTAIKE